MNTDRRTSTDSALGTSETETALDAGTRRERLTDCMTDQGWPVKQGSDGSISVQLPSEQAEAYEEALTGCIDEVGGGPAELGEQPPEFWSEWFEAEKQTADCLRRLGYDISEAPSLTVFTEGHLAGNGWLPYAEVPDVSQSIWQDLNKQCPQFGDRG